MIKKAAMFGLDARIALAIFGALSVISGAALYSAIQKAKFTKYYVAFTELEKAFNAYVLDTGDMNFNSSNPDLNMLYENAKGSTTPVPYWNGPYLSAKYDVTGNKKFAHINLGEVFLLGHPSSGASICENGYAMATPTYYFRTDLKGDVNGDSCNGNLVELKKFHDMFDNDGDYLAGKIKVIQHSSQNTGAVFFKLDTISKG
jgi:type II secretory pathway pseudopilin PulG